MESQRQQKVNKLLQRQLAEYFRLNAIIFGGCMISVTKVSVTKDLSIAKVYLSLFATKDKQAVFDKIVEKSQEVRYDLGKTIKNQMRVVPELHFYLDDSLDYIENIDNLLKD